MRVVLSREADADVDAILDYSITAYGRAVAEAYLNTVNAALERLADYPNLGVPRSDLKIGLRSLPVGEHRLYYRVDTDSILVSRVLHKVMDPARHL